MPARSRISRRSARHPCQHHVRRPRLDDQQPDDRAERRHNPQCIGLFGVIGPSGVVRDLNLANVNVTANPGVTFQTVGTLAGTNLGTVSGVTADGTVNGGTVTDAALGGLVGANGDFGFGFGSGPGSDHQLARGRRREQRRHQRGVGRARRIQRSGLDHLRLIRQRRRDRHRRRQQGRRGLLVQQFVPACVRRRPGRRQPRHHRLLRLRSATSSSAANGTAGGLVGFNSGIIANSFAAGNVTGAPGSGGVDGDGGSTTLGGLVGINQGLISNSVGDRRRRRCERCQPAGRRPGRRQFRRDPVVHRVRQRAGGRRQQCRRPGRLQFGQQLQLLRLHARRRLAVLQHRRHLQLARVRRRHGRRDRVSRADSWEPATA